MILESPEGEDKTGGPWQRGQGPDPRGQLPWSPVWAQTRAESQASGPGVLRGTSLARVASPAWSPGWNAAAVLTAEA